MMSKLSSCIATVPMRALYFTVAAAIISYISIAELMAEGHLNDVLKVCSDPHMLPFSNQEKQGYENKIAELLGDKLGKKVEYTFFPQRIGFIRNTLRSELDGGGYKCDLVVTVPDGFELAATTKPYYASTWVLVYAKGRGYDAIKESKNLQQFVTDNKLKPRIGITDKGPGQLWVFYQGMMPYMQPYQGQTGDLKKHPGHEMIKDIVANKLDMAVLWGPIAGYYSKEYKNRQELVVLPLEDSTEINREMIFSYNISMAVRHGEAAWKNQLNELIEEHQEEITEILQDYNIPMVPIRDTVIDDD